MTDELRAALAARDFERIENIWMEMMERGDCSPDDFLALAGELKKIDAGNRPLILLELLAGHYEASHNPVWALEVYKSMTTYTHDLTTVRCKIIELYKQIHARNPNFDEFLQRSNLSREENLKRAIERLEEYLRYDVGQLFYFERYGLGEVVEIHPAQREVVINFEKKERHFLKFEVAAGLLKTVKPDQFFYIKFKEPDRYHALARQQPELLIRMLLENTGEPMTVAQIKANLTGPLSTEEVDRLWDRVKKSLEQDKNFRIVGRTQKTYQFITAGIDRTAEAVASFREARGRERYALAIDFRRRVPEVLSLIKDDLIKDADENYQKDPALALDIVLLLREENIAADFAFDPETLIQSSKLPELLTGLSCLEHQRYVVTKLKERHPESWPRQLKNLMLSLEDHAVLDELEKQLQSYPDLIADLYQTIITLPGHYSRPFPWLLKKISEGQIERFLTPLYLPKIIAGLDFIRGQKAVVKKIFSLDRFDAIIQKAAAEDGQRILNAIMASEAFADFEKKDLLRIIEYHFPQLFARTEDVIYATVEAQRRKQAELEHILKVAIPENKKEISRAREFGDLSENFEYKAAKERQDQLYQRLKDLQADLSRVRLIEPQKVSLERVGVGTKVTLQDNKGNEITYTILGRWDTDLARNIIANEAPAARQLLNKKEGDTVELSGVTYTIHRIQAADLSSPPAAGDQAAD